ncbi:MAG: HipA N-terminal domain-containing protein [Candidatus Kapabacteria bacterium]|jgi:serine/threonine-protein kinase HipA|nr:HipA N-terminal domain-containing protein [Candidatus Kapabacteria bacterium]
MSRKVRVFMHQEFAGILSETDSTYRFEYDDRYMSNGSNLPLSLSLPFTDKAYESQSMLSFFDGLIPEGWLLDIAEKNWKIDPRDRMGLLTECCRDCIGAVSIEPEE